MPQMPDPQLAYSEAMPESYLSFGMAASAHPISPSCSPIVAFTQYLEYFIWLMVAPLTQTESQDLGQWR